MSAKSPKNKKSAAVAVRSLPLRAAQAKAVKGGVKPKASVLTGSCATGVHFKEATITV